MKILLVEDEPRMAEALVELLRQEGYDVDWFANGEEGFLALESGLYDGAVLDVMLPGKDGFDIVHDARTRGIVTPVLMLTAKGTTADKVHGLDVGADDYLAKPFDVSELLARVRALVRRGSGAAVGGVLSYGDIQLHPDSFALQCTTTGESVRLGEKEFRLLEFMVVNQGQILSREQLSMKVWGYDNDSEYNNLEVYMSFTRKKLAFVGSRVKIKAVRGVGYELTYEEQ